MDRERETVVVDTNRSDRNNNTGLIVIVVIALLLILFFLFGGLNMFSGGTPVDSGGSSTGDTNVEIQAPAETAPAPSGSTPGGETTPAQ